MRFPSNNPILKEEELKLPNTQFYHLLRNCISPKTPCPLKTDHQSSKRRRPSTKSEDASRLNLAWVSNGHQWPSLRVYLVFRRLVADTFVFWMNVNENRRRTCVFIESSYSSHVWYRSRGRNQTVLDRIVQFVLQSTLDVRVQSPLIIIFKNHFSFFRSRNLNSLNESSKPLSFQCT